LIAIKESEIYDHYILNQAPDLNMNSIYIEEDHLLVSIGATLRSNRYVLISESQEVSFNDKLIKSKQLHIEENYLSLNISLKNKIKTLPKMSDITSLINLKTYFKKQL